MQQASISLTFNSYTGSDKSVTNLVPGYISTCLSTAVGNEHGQWAVYIMKLRRKGDLM